MSMPADDPIARYTEAMQANQTANPNPTPKQLLDAYRAMNGGALPPGMTPEQAQLIDFGMGADLLAANPGLAALFQQITRDRAQQAADFSAARAQVGQNYQDLTGDVENQGNQWMADIAKAMGLTPEQMAMDPNVNQYGQTIQNMGETADQNQATDQAWFDKMAQVYDQSSAAMLQSIAMGQMAPVDGSGGGGGGGGGYGGGRRGGRGYGGGGSGGDGWSDPSTTDSMTEAAAADALRNYPGFSEHVLGMFEGDPEMQEQAARYMDQYGGLPHNVAKGMAINDVPAIEALLETMGGQREQFKTYQGTVPALAEGAVARLQSGDYAEQGRSNALAQGINVPTRDAVFRQEGFDPTSDAPEVNDPNNEVYKRVRDQTSTRQYLTPQQRQSFGDDFGIMLMNLIADQHDQRGSVSAEDYRANAPRPGQSGVDWARNINQVGRSNGQSQAEKLRLAAQILQAKKDKAEYEVAAEDPDFSFEGWEGYTPPVDREKEQEQEWLYEIAANVLGAAREFSPNYGWQDTKMTMKDSSSQKTTQKTKDPDFQMFDNNVSMEMPADDGQGNIGWGETGVGAFGESRGTRLSAAAQRLIQNKMDAVKAAGEANQQAPVGRTEGPSGWDRATSPFASKRTAKAPANKPQSNWGGLAKKAASGATKKSPNKWSSVGKKAAGGAVKRPKKKRTYTPTRRF